MAQDRPINYQHFFLKLLEITPWPLLIIDRSLIVRFHNQRAVQLLETPEPWRGLKLDQLISDAAILQLVQQSVATNSPRSEEHSRGNSNSVWKISVTPVEHHPVRKTTQQSYHYFALVIEDLSELRRLERVRRDFITNISHELRTPLASVRLLAETLEEVIETDPEKAQEFVEKIENEVEQLNALVSELLELSRIESGQLPMTIEPLEAEQLVREVMARMLAQAQRHRVTLRTEIQQGEMLVAADSKQVARVLVNLVHNAIKFTPAGGTVVIGTGRGKPAPLLPESTVVIGTGRGKPTPLLPEGTAVIGTGRGKPTPLLAGGNTQSFFVRDTGVGIPPEDLPRIFERFYKVNRSRTRGDFIGPGGGGSGLGLAIARHVIEAHGGRITAESVVGQGSTFTFTLPLLHAPGRI